MVKTKQAIIKRQGVPVEILGTDQHTIALIGRASKQFSNTVSLESHRRGFFLPEVVVDSGSLVRDGVIDETYLVVGAYKEVINRQIVSTVGHMLVCNALISVEGEIEDADEYGNIKKETVPKATDLPVYVQAVNADVRFSYPSLHSEAEKVIYCSLLDVDLLDKIYLIDEGGSRQTFEAVAIDLFTFPGLSLLQVKADVR